MVVRKQVVGRWATKLRSEARMVELVAGERREKMGRKLCARRKQGREKGSRNSEATSRWKLGVHARLHLNLVSVAD